MGKKESDLPGEGLFFIIGLCGKEVHADVRLHGRVLGFPK